MKHKQSKSVCNTFKAFDCRRPLRWDEVAMYLEKAIKRFNQEDGSLIPDQCDTKFKVRVQSIGVPEMEKIYCMTNHHQIWIEDAQDEMIHFNLLCGKPSSTNSMFLQNGVKYNHFILIGNNASICYLDKIINYLVQSSIFYRV